MKAPAPFNPSTLRRIRSGASAQDLGWPQERYRRVCRDHGLVAIEEAAQQPQAPLPKVIVTREVDPTLPVFDAQVAEFIAGGIRVYIPGRLGAAIISALVESFASDPDRLTLGGELAARLDTSGSEISAAVAQLNRRLASAPWRVETRMGRSGGYRLARTMR